MWLVRGVTQSEVRTLAQIAEVLARPSRLGADLRLLMALHGENVSLVDVIQERESIVDRGICYGMAILVYDCI
jgi:hypothetical protein